MKLKDHVAIHSEFSVKNIFKLLFCTQSKLLIVRESRLKIFPDNVSKIKTLMHPFSGSTKNYALGKRKIKTGNKKVREPGNRRAKSAGDCGRHPIRPGEEFHRAAV